MVKKQKSFFILLAILIGMGVGILIWHFLGPSLGRGIFYYKVEGDKADLFLVKGQGEAKKIISFSAEEVDLGKYKPPRRSYISHNGKQMVYFKKTGEVPIEELNQDESIVVSRIIFEPILVNLNNNKEHKINQPIESSGLLFSPDDSYIVWVKQIEESTYQSIDQSGKKREVWISKSNGEGAKFLANFDENVILLKRWVGNYIYFQGLWDTTLKSLGRINIKTKKVDYLVPQGCEKFLENCQNIEFSSNGRYFLYEIYNKTREKEITELYLGDFEKREFRTILTTDRISDRLWLNNKKQFFYTEQEMVKEEEKGKELREKIHLVDIDKEIEGIIYTGSYISQLTIDPNGRYLYFLEKEKEGENFKLNQLDIRTREVKTILTGDYNHILLIQ